MSNTIPTDEPTPARYLWRWRGVTFDFYRLCEILSITHHAQAHALKKIIRAGRSIKTIEQDIDETIASLLRWKQMLEEDKNAESSDTESSDKAITETLKLGLLRRFVHRFRCRFKGHDWKVGRYSDESSYAVCKCCGERREPVPRTDGCTPVWDAPNAFKCRHSLNHVAKSWGGLCPAHRCRERLHSGDGDEPRQSR